MRFVQAMKWFEGNRRPRLLVLIRRGRHLDNYQHLIISYHRDFIAVHNIINIILVQIVDTNECISKARSCKADGAEANQCTEVQQVRVLV